MTVTWALVADRSRARILESRGPARPLDLVENIEHPEGHLRDRDFDTDAHGRVFDRAGEARHAMQPRQLPHEHDAERFAHLLADRLRDARNDHRFDRLVIAAEPHFLGILRQMIDPVTRKAIVAEVPKHLLGAGDGDLAAEIAGALRR